MSQEQNGYFEKRRQTREKYEQQEAQIKLIQPPQTHGFPALLSLFWPGLGQCVKGDWGNGLATMVLMIISISLIFVGIGLITTPLIWIWSVYDSYNKPV